jgi:ankyrin repeat protein
VCCQLAHICGCIPARIRRALADLPETLDETYERTLREINKADWEFAHRIFQFVAVAVRPLGVEELAELLAFDFEAGPIPKFHEDWRLDDPMQAVLSICPSFLAVVDEKTVLAERKVVQFSHFSVKEFLTSARLAKAMDIILRRYHISETPAHTLAAQACLGYLLHVDKGVTRTSLQNPYFAEYSAGHWVRHVRFEDVSRNVEDGLKELFDPSKPHLAVCIWLLDPHIFSWNRYNPWDRPQRPSPLRGTPLHYAALWDLHSIVELLINEHSQNVNSQDFTGSATPLHLASNGGHMNIARRLLECGADVKAQNEDKETPLHMASKRGQLEVARVLIEHDADVSAQDKDGRTPIHLASQAGKPEVACLLIEHGADVSAQDEGGQTPLHMVPLWNPFLFGLTSSPPKVARMLIEHGADVSAQDRDRQTPLHLALQSGKPHIARMLIEHGADVSAQGRDSQTPLHLALQDGKPHIARMLIEHGADVSAQDKDSQTPLHVASRKGQLEIALMLVERGASVFAQNKDGQTPLHMVPLGNRYSFGLTSSHPEVARMLIEHGADVSAQDNDSQTPLDLASGAGELEVARMLIEHGASVSGHQQNQIGLY